jgi:hypothetical protein
MEMPKVSRDSAPQRQEAGPVVDLRGELDGYTMSFTTVLEDLDAVYRCLVADQRSNAAAAP